MELKGKVAIVTGAAKGIGEGIALAFAREGARVVVNDLDFERATGVVRAIEAKGGSALAVKADVSRKAEVQVMVARVLETYKTIDILVNNAGIEAPPMQVKDIPEAQWDRVLSINLKGTFLCCQAVIPTMTAKRSGKIVNIASLAAQRMSFFGSADYTASKHGMAGFSHHLAWELAAENINVNVICPGAVVTPLMESGTTPELRKQLTSRLIPLGRMCTPKDIAEAAVFLASERASMITGQLLDVDGGTMLGYGEDLREIVSKRMKQSPREASAGSAE